VPLIAPESAGRRGALPELMRAIQCRRGTRHVLVSRIRDEHANGRRLDDIAVLYRFSGRARSCARRWTTPISLPLAEGVKGGKGSLFLVKDSVKLVTMHSSKGLEFPLVIIPGLGQMPKAGEDEAAKRACSTSR
jgi:hypothetical protein